MITTKAGTKLIPAACYVRMSSDKQEDSPEQQRAELRKLAKLHGYEIVREYFDSGRSGTDTKARADFLHMMRDVQNGPDFQFILVWDQDRFSRGDAVEANHWWYLLREAGVQIHSVAQGIIKTDELGSWLTASVTQHGKRQYVVDLSRNVLRGTLKLAREGRPTGKLPYGFKQVVTNGEQTIYLKRGCGTRKPKGWESRLELSDDQQEVDTVRWMFETYANSTSSIRSIAVDLNDRGIPSPEGAKWSVQVVKGILVNPTYIGRKDYGANRQGKLHQVTDAGEIGTPETNKGRRRTAPIQVDNAHASIVSVELFERVQERLHDRRVTNRKPRSNGFLLSGLLYCGHCGSRMCGHARHKGDRHYRDYACTGSASKGGCLYQRISAGPLEEFVIELLKQNLLSPEAIARLRKQIEKRLAERGQKEPDRAKSLQTQVAELDKKIKRGTANLLEADPRHVRDMSDMLNDLRTKRASLQAQLDGLSVAKASKASVEAAIANLERLAGILKSPDRAKVKELMHSMIERIELWFRREGTRARLAKGNCILIGPGGSAPFDKIGSPMLQAPVPGLFPQRNRIISGLSLGVIVIEAGRHSGALHTARHAMEQNRDLFAVPGRIDSDASHGCLDLIRDGAMLIRGVEDVLEALGPLTNPVKTTPTETVHQPRELQLSDQERAVLNSITADAISIDEVLRASSLESSRVLATLTVLEMKKLIRRLPGGFLIRL